MDKVFNLGIPHVGERIFKSFDDDGLFQFALVSETWKVLAENVLIKRWKGRMADACLSGETKIIRVLLERCNSEESGLNIKDGYGYTPFMWACFKGQKDVVKLLLKNSEIIELNARNTFGVTAFMLACQNGHKDVVKLLLEHPDKIELNARNNNNGNTALMNACLFGYKDVVKLLLEHPDKIELNARNNRGETALILAYEQNDIYQLFP